MLIHPILTELGMAVPNRILQRLSVTSDPISRTVPVLHAQLHAAIMGRALLLSMSTPQGIWITAVLVEITQVLFRVTLEQRDLFMMRLVKVLAVCIPSTQSNSGKSSVR